MALLKSAGRLLGIPKEADLQPRRILPIQRMVVVDASGNVGLDITNLYQYRGGTYSYSWALVDSASDYSGSGLGTVSFYEAAGNVIGGREYPTVTIGGVTWLAENLDFKFSGLAVGQGGTSTTEPRANYYNNNEAVYGVDGNKYGLLYNWVAVKYLNDNRAELIPGWHVPSTAEWDALATAVGGSSVAGTKLKSTTGWSSGNGDGSYGFNAYPAGYYAGSFNDVGSNANFWTSTEYSSTFAYYRLFSTGASMGSSYHFKDYGYSVRLVKDSSPS